MSVSLTLIPDSPPCVRRWHARCEIPASRGGRGISRTVLQNSGPYECRSCCVETRPALRRGAGRLQRGIACDASWSAITRCSSAACPPIGVRAAKCSTSPPAPGCARCNAPRRQDVHRSAPGTILYCPWHVGSVPADRRCAGQCCVGVAVSRRMNCDRASSRPRLGRNSRRQ